MSKGLQKQYPDITVKKKRLHPHKLCIKTKPTSAKQSGIFLKQPDPKWKEKFVFLHSFVGKTQTPAKTAVLLR